MMTLQIIVLSFVATVLLVGFGLLLIADRYSDEPSIMNGRAAPIDVLNPQPLQHREDRTMNYYCESCGAAWPVPDTLCHYCGPYNDHTHSTWQVELEHA